MSSFFAMHSTGPSCPTYLVVALSQEQLCLSAHQKKDSFVDVYVQTAFDRNPNSLAIQNSFARALLSFNYSASLIQFRFVPPNPRLHTRIPPLAPFFLALKSIEKLYTTVDGLSFIMAQWVAKDQIFFPALETVFLLDPASYRDTANRIKPFFINRLHISPIRVLNLTESSFYFGDLRPLDEIIDLKVIWIAEDSSDSRTMEYVCGSGTPSRLLSTV